MFQRLTAYAEVHRCDPPSPPIPLILAGWVYSNDDEKKERWEATVLWANRNGCSDVVDIPDRDFHWVVEPTSYAVGPMGGPMYRPWDFESKERPLPDRLSEHLKTLTTRWHDIVGSELACVTRPLEFSGAKRRRLLVEADATARPPWGSWAHLSAMESERRAFTRFRAVINRAIAPHEVDHIDFITRGQAEQR